MPLTAVVWPQFAKRVQLGVQSVPPLGGLGVFRGSQLVPQGSGRATLFTSTDSFFSIRSEHFFINHASAHVRMTPTDIASY